MSELAKETLEQHHHIGHNPDDHHAKRAALIIGILAATLAVCEMTERNAQTVYVAQNIAASNEYAFYQSRQNRALILQQTATIMSALPPTPDSEKTIATDRAEAARLTEDSDRGNGAKQILARATAAEHAREAALHRYEWFELVTSALQIAIVLASVSVVTTLTRLIWVSAAIGAVAAAVGLATVTRLI